MRLKFTTEFNKWTFVLVLLSFLILSEGAYKEEQYLDSISCSSRHTISLQSNKTLVIKLSRWADYHRGLSFLNFQCKFQVIAPRGYGIMAIVQLLHLRTKNTQGSACRDSLRFENSDGLEAGPICGEVLEGDTIEKPKQLVGPRSFYDPKGILDVAFKFDDSRLDDVQKPFKLELSFTAYTECTSTAIVMRQVRQCSASRPYSCIAQNLFCDGLINCGHRGDFGLDETQCAPPSPSITETPPLFGDYPPLLHEGPIHRVDLGRTNKDDATVKVKGQMEDDDETANEKHLGVPVHYFALVSAICGALVVWLVVIICCCLVKNVSRRNLMMRQSPSQRTVELNLHHSSAPVRDTPIRSEVPLGAIISKPGDDLPPSYEAIFPEPVPQKR